MKNVLQNKIKAMQKSATNPPSIPVSSISGIFRGGFQKTLRSGRVFTSACFSLGMFVDSSLCYVNSGRVEGLLCSPAPRAFFMKT